MDYWKGIVFYCVEHNVYAINMSHGTNQHVQLWKQKKNIFSQIEVYLFTCVSNALS